MNPALVIGLGGTGLEVIMFLRRKIVQRFGAVKNLSLVSFLHIDTDQSLEAQGMPSTQYLGEDIGLVENDRLQLTVAGGNQWKDNQTVRA